jgi:NAD(P)-dependent dehydrogenase (short-subunit alcohol dehydrogenase family)
MGEAMTLSMMTPHAPRAVKKRALVTGGAIRVGRAIALALARAGMDVAIGYHRSAREARRTVHDIEACGVRGAALRGDLADARVARRLVGDAARVLGRLDVLVNSAAVFERSPLAATTPAQYDRLLDVNLRGVFFASQAAAALMPRGAHIVNIGDVGAERAWPGYIPYTISKAGVAALTRGFAAALRPRGITVNCVAPGHVLRPAGFPLARWNTLTRGHEVSPKEVAAAALFFATCPPNVTGQILAVDASSHR